MSRQTGYQDTYGRNQDLAFRPNRKGGPGGGYNPGGSGGGGGGRGGQTCHTCGELGHISRNCPKGTSGGGPSTERRNPHGPPSNNVEGGRAPTTALAISAETKTETQKENTLVRSFISKPRTAERNPYRPSYGTKGTLVEFQTNYFPVNLPPELLLHRYKINIDAIVDEKGKELPKPRNKKLKQIIKILLPILASRDSKICIATDFQSTLICSGEIPQNRRNQEIKYFNENDSEPGKDAQKYKLHIEEIKPPLEVSELQKLLASTEDTVEYEHRDSIVQALNILFGHYAKSSPTTTIVGGNRVYTDDAQRSPLNGGLEAIRGYFLSVRLASFRILVNVNVSHGAFYETVSLRDLIDIWSKKNALRNENDCFRLQTFLKGVKVKTNYLEDERRNQITKVRSIKGFASQRDGAGKDFPPFVEILAAPPQQVWFYCDDKRDFRKQKYKLKDEEGNVKHKYISVEEFFKSNHNVESDRDGRYPVINYGSRQDPMYVPTEACFVERGQLGKLTPEQTEAMISFAVRSPSQNVKSIKDAGLPALGLFPISSEMKRLSLNVSPKMITVCGRMLSVPSVLYKGNAIATSSSGGWNLRNVQFKISLPKATDNTLKNWGCLRLQNYSDKHQQGIHESAISEFRNILRNCGIGTEDPVEQTLIFDKEKECFCNEKGRSLEQWIAISRWKQKIDIILVILPIKDTALYNQIKRLFDRAEGIHTVCVTVKENRGKGKFYSRNGTYLANVALKFNLKLGGTNHTLGDIEMGIVSQGKTMVVGIDVIHPSPGAEKASVASMVASINKDLAQWPVDLRVQLRKGQEMLDRIYEMLKSRLLLWKTHHGVYPENILVYRDGVSESQYEQVLDDELVDMQKACQDLYDTVSQPLPRITLIIVGKRHHTRFYPPNQHPAGDKNGNPQRGLVVDRGITEARKWDFFLQSHNAIQGTARPAHYIVLWDEIFTNHKLESVHQAVQPNVQPVDRLERVTHSMCYLFSRATKAVSIPAPVYYADIACERAKRYIVESSADTESGITDTKDMTDGQRERLRFDLQKQIDLHIDLKDSMFYI